MIRLAKILEAKAERETAPVAFFETHSPSLNIPMRIEVPLRAIIKGCPRLQGGYVVYLHGLITQEKQEFKYYGVTKRGWSKRFNEHVVQGLGDGSRRLFSSKMSELIHARTRELTGTKVDEPRLAEIITSICAVGLNEDAAMDTEEYLVDKYSLASKHGNGLNMIPGGREGIRALHRLSLGQGCSISETDEREAMLDEYLQSHPRLGKANPGVAEKWNDSSYFEAVVCARENRLNATKCGS